MRILERRMPSIEMSLIIRTHGGIEEQNCSLSLRSIKFLCDPCLFGQQFHQHSGARALSEHLQQFLHKACF